MMKPSFCAKTSGYSPGSACKRKFVSIDGVPTLATSDEFSAQNEAESRVRVPDVRVPVEAIRTSVTSDEPIVDVRSFAVAPGASEVPPESEALKLVALKAWKVQTPAVKAAMLPA